MDKITKHQEESFWSKVKILSSKELCWEWQGARKPKGYGNVRINKRDFLAHRIAFYLANGEFPQRFQVCHVCDNPSCCNPRHLMLGNNASNYADMVIKNRQQFNKNKCSGEVNGNSKLKSADVVKIRTIYKSKKLNQYELADLFGVTQTTIGSIVNNKTWRNVNV